MPQGAGRGGCPSPYPPLLLCQVREEALCAELERRVSVQVYNYPIDMYTSFSEIALRCGSDSPENELSAL